MPSTITTLFGFGIVLRPNVAPRCSCALFKAKRIFHPFSLRDMGGTRCDEIWSRASNSTRQYGVPLNFAFVCFLILTGASELATDTSRGGGELGKAQSLFCAKIPPFASINQNSCYHFYPPRLIDYITCIAIPHTHLLFSFPLSMLYVPNKSA